MRHVPSPGPVCLLFVALALAGCTSGSGTTDDGGGPVVDAQPGQLCALAVDESIRPLVDATIRIEPGGLEAVTDERGIACFPDLQPGTYLVSASHPLYDAVVHSVEVTSDAAPPLVRFLLTRVVLGDPYTQQIKFEGFIVCSIGFSVYASEECGEGLGIPCEVPVLGCQRVGGQENNAAQFDFYTDGVGLRQIVLENVWEPSTDLITEFYFISATEWTCDPFCIGNELNLTLGGSPMYQTIDVVNSTASGPRGTAEVTPDTRFSTFVWPNWGCNGIAVPNDPECMQQLNVAVNQDYVVFATIAYNLPLETGWSFVAGDELPY